MSRYNIKEKINGEVTGNNSINDSSGDETETNDTEKLKRLLTIQLSQGSSVNQFRVSLSKGQKIFPFVLDGGYGLYIGHLNHMLIWRSDGLENTDSHEGEFRVDELNNIRVQISSRQGTKTISELLGLATEGEKEYQNIVSAKIKEVFDELIFNRTENA